MVLKWKVNFKNQNFIQDEIKRCLNSGYVCRHSLQKFVFSSAVKKRKN
jgi:hypothetical protein